MNAKCNPNRFFTGTSQKYQVFMFTIFNHNTQFLSFTKHVSLRNTTLFVVSPFTKTLAKYQKWSNEICALIHTRDLT